MRPPRATQTDTRGQAYAFIAQYPGVSVSRLAEGLGVSPACASYHAWQLEREGKVRRGSGLVFQRSGLFACDHRWGEEEMCVAMASWRPGLVRLLRALEGHEEAPFAVVLERAGRGADRHTMDWHLRTAVACGLAWKVRDDERRVMVRLLPRGAAVLAFAARVSENAPVASAARAAEPSTA